MSKEISSKELSRLAAAHNARSARLVKGISASELKFGAKLPQTIDMRVETLPLQGVVYEKDKSAK